MTEDQKRTISAAANKCGVTEQEIIKAACTILECDDISEVFELLARAYEFGETKH